MADLSCSRTNKKRSSFTTKHFQRKSLNFRPSSAAEKVSIVCGTNNHVKSEMLSNRHTHRPSTVTFAAHARRGLMKPVCRNSASIAHQTHATALTQLPAYCPATVLPHIWPACHTLHAFSLLRPASHEAISTQLYSLANYIATCLLPTTWQYSQEPCQVINDKASKFTPSPHQFSLPL